jgi:hypothetical protein
MSGFSFPLYPFLPFTALPPFVPFTGLPGGLPSGIAIVPPTLGNGEPGILTPGQSFAQQANFFNTVLAQGLNNPVAALVMPFTLPITLSQQMTVKSQTGTLVPHVTNVTVPASGGFTQLQPLGTLISGGQLQNNSLKSIGVTTLIPGTTNPDIGSASSVAAGGIFNFGPIDLGSIYIGNLTDQSPVNVKIYAEQ